MPRCPWSSCSTSNLPCLGFALPTEQITPSSRCNSSQKRIATVVAYFPISTSPACSAMHPNGKKQTARLPCNTTRAVTRNLECICSIWPFQRANSHLNKKKKQWCIKSAGRKTLWTTLCWGTGQKQILTYFLEKNGGAQPSEVGKDQ